MLLRESANRNPCVKPFPVPGQRIEDDHRFVYRLEGSMLEILACRYHDRLEGQHPRTVREQYAFTYGNQGLA